jgi:hypothetical protein
MLGNPAILSVRGVVGTMQWVDWAQSPNVVVEAVGVGGQKGEEMREGQRMKVYRVRKREESGVAA